MIPSLPTIARALWNLVARMDRLYASLGGSADHASRAGVRAAAGAAGAAGGPPRATADAAGAGGIHRQRKVPDQSSPAAFLAALIRPSTVAGVVCASARPWIVTSVMIKL